jgi:hypothetical protein
MFVNFVRAKTYGLMKIIWPYLNESNSSRSASGFCVPHCVSDGAFLAAPFWPEMLETEG